MSTVIYLDKLFQQPFCSRKVYLMLLDYMFENASHFMLVYAYSIREGQSNEIKETKKALSPYAIKTRHNPQWPGTIRSHSNKYYYDVVFYKADICAKDVLKKVQSLNSWRGPSYPENLAFFKQNKCWFYSIGHEQMASIIRATKEDKLFFEALGITCSSDILEVSDEYFLPFDENF